MSGMVKSVVIADPQPVLRLGICTLIESTGNYLIVATPSDEIETHCSAATHDPDIIVADLSVADLSVSEFIGGLRRLAPRAKIVLYSSVRREHLCTDAISAGADGLIFKFEPECQLLRALAAVAVGRRFFSSTIPTSIFAGSKCTRLVTPRERQVVSLIAMGMNHRAIAQSLGISQKTVETHRAKVSEKLNCRTTADLVRYALRNEIVAA